MRDSAKRPTAGSNQRRVKSLGSVAVGALLAGVALLVLAPLSQAKVPVNGFGATDSPGGDAGTIESNIAINQTGSGAPVGTIYTSGRNRLQRFSPAGAFERLWGAGVVKSGGAGDNGSGFEICTVAADCTGGSASLTGDGLNFNGGPRGLAINPATGDVYTHAGNRRIIQFDAEGNFIRAWGRDVIQSGKPGDLGNVFEICEVAADCKGGNTGTLGGQFGEQRPSNLAIDSSGHLWVPDPSHHRVQEFEADGTFVAVHGFDVDAAGGGGELESCTVAANCQAGTQGAGAGQFSSDNPKDIAFDAAGNLYAIDSGNGRVQRFDPTFSSASDFAAATFDTYTTGGPEHMIAIEGGEGLLFSLNNNVTATPSERQVIEVDPADGSVEEESLVGLGLTGLQGLGFDEASGTQYMTTSSNQSPFDVIELGEPLPPIAHAIESVTNKTDTTATFPASVDPLGGWVGECRFQYSTDEFNWTDVPEPDCPALDVDGGSQELAQSVTGLDPNTHYFVRFQASRPLTPGSTVTTSVTAFDTDAPPPVVTDVGAVQVTDTSARLAGTIDPRNSETDYVFEYGTTAALGSSTPPLAIGSGTTPITVSQLIGGLKPDTTYHFRLVATNPAGSTPSSGHTLTTRATPLPNPSNRAWEMVTPPDKNYSEVQREAGISPDGNTVAFCTQAQFGEPPGQMTQFCAPYVSKRGPGGWQTSHPFPEYCYTDPTTGVTGSNIVVFVSGDFSRYAVRRGETAGCPDGLLDPAAPLHPEGKTANNLYYEDPSTNPFDYELLNPVLDAKSGGANRVVGGSDDFRHVFYISNVAQTPDADPGDFTKLYDWERQGSGDCVQPGGCLSLVSKDSGNAPLTVGSAPATLSGFGGASILSPSAVSDDGERIYFQTPGGAALGLGGCGSSDCDLLMREGGAATLDVGASECTEECGSSDPGDQDRFISATPDGGTAFFASCEKLTDESNAAQVSCDDPWSGSGIAPGGKLYRWDRDAPSGGRLVDLTVDQEPSDGIQADLFGLIGHSEDGETAYFVTANQIVSGEPTFPTGAVPDGNGFQETTGLKLYRWQWNGGSPTVDYLGPHDEFKGSSAVDYNIFQRRRQVTPDGERLLLHTKVPYDAAGDRDSDADAYRWDEQSGWICLSCQLPGAPSGGDVIAEELRLAYFETLLPTLGAAEPQVHMSEDGERIFFATPDSLLPADVNGELACPVVDEIGLQHTDIRACDDVYEWHDGRLSLVSAGSGSSPSRLIGADLSGSAVFFYTAERLVGWDRDNNTDLYSSRIGGGFPEPAPQPPECEGEGCREDGTEAPTLAGAGSAVFQGPGNPKAGARRNRCGGNKLRRGKRCLRVRAIARKRCRRLNGAAKRRCIRKQTRRLRRAQRRAKRRRQARGTHANRRNAR